NAAADIIPIRVERQSAALPDLHGTCPRLPADGVAERQFARNPPMISAIGRQFPVAETAIDVPETHRITGRCTQAQVGDRVTSKVVAETQGPANFLTLITVVLLPGHSKPRAEDVRSTVVLDGSVVMVPVDGPINGDTARLWPEMCQSAEIYRPNGVTGGGQQSALTVERRGEIQHRCSVQDPVPGHPPSIPLVFRVRL